MSRVVSGVDGVQQRPVAVADDPEPLSRPHEMRVVSTPGDGSTRLVKVRGKPNTYTWGTDPPIPHPRGARVVSVPARPVRPRCGLCGRERLSREEYNWRRRNGYAVWRCQHRRRSPRRRDGLLEAGAVIAALIACMVAVGGRRI